MNSKTVAKHRWLSKSYVNTP